LKTVKEKVDLREVFKEVTTLLLRKANQKKIKLFSTFDENLPKYVMSD